MLVKIPIFFLFKSVAEGLIVLGSRNTSGVWETQLLSSSHNCQNPAEVRRVKEAHPEEMEAIVGIRTLGLITLTRGTQLISHVPITSVDNSLI